MGAGKREEQLDLWRHFRMNSSHGPNGALSPKPRLICGPRRAARTYIRTFTPCPAALCPASLLSPPPRGRCFVDSSLPTLTQTHKSRVTRHASTTHHQWRNLIEQKRPCGRIRLRPTHPSRCLSTLVRRAQTFLADHPLVRSAFHRTFYIYLLPPPTLYPPTRTFHLPHTPSTPHQSIHFGRGPDCTPHHGFQRRHCCCRPLS